MKQHIELCGLRSLSLSRALSLSLAKDDALVIQSLNKLKSKDEKLDTLIQKYAELVSHTHSHSLAQPCIYMCVHLFVNGKW